MLYSFDVFDTIITRKTATPRGIFALMQSRIASDLVFRALPAFFYHSFRELRIGAERQARKFYSDQQHSEISLDQIYSVLAKDSGLSEEQRDKLMELERDIELENVLPIPSMINKLLQLKGDGHRVILISDMYLDENTIRKMLIKADPGLGEIPLYVSSSFGHNKVSEKLYELISENEKISYDEWVHVGDHPIADQKIPQKLGIGVEPVERKNLLPIEEKTLELYEGNAAIQLLVGTSVNTRFFHEELCKESPGYRYGTSLLLPLLYAYTSWILERSISMGIETLYFIARDGFAIKIMADKLIACRNLSIETRYIYGSRKTWRLPAFSEIFWDIPLFFQWSESTKDYTVEHIAHRFQMPVEEFIRYLPEGYQADTVIGRLGKEEIAACLQDNLLFKEAIIQREAERKEIVLAYLDQEIGSSRENYAFVDFVGSGYTQRALAELLKCKTDYPTTTFFFRLAADIESPYCRNLCFFPASIDKSLEEALLFAPHGSTVGYTSEKGKVEPILNKEDEILINYGMDQFLQGYEDAVDGLGDYDSIPLSVIQTWIKYLEETPDTELMDFIGDIPFAKSGRESKNYSYAPKLCEKDIDVILSTRTIEPIGLFYQGTDFRYSLKRSGMEERNLPGLREVDFSEHAVERRNHFWAQSPIRRVNAIGCVPILTKAGDRIAVYGAGRLGRIFVEAVREEKAKELVCWVDQNADQLCKEGLDVIPVSDLSTKEFDHIIVALTNADKSKEVCNFLIRQGVPRTKILSYRGL